MRALLGVALLVSVACGGKPTTPELIQRQLPTGRIMPKVEDTPHGDPLDAGGGYIDAGCCAVAFALPSASLDEVIANVVFPEGTFPLYRDDAGAWRGSACLDPHPTYFHFEVAYPADDEDGGLLFVPVVNPAVPLSDRVAPGVVENAFDVDGGVCGGIDAQRYVSLPDAG